MCNSIGSEIQLVVCHLLTAMYGDNDLRMGVDDAFESFVDCVMRNSTFWAAAFLKQRLLIFRWEVEHVTEAILPVHDVEKKLLEQVEFLGKVKTIAFQTDTAAT
jgi:hypothetical protein